MNVETCDVCGYPKAHIRYLARTYGKGKDLLIIENVPVISCPNCGTSYLTAETLQQLDKIRGDRKNYTIMRSVETASLG